MPDLPSEFEAIENLLRQTAAAVVYPPTPRLAAAVRARVDRGQVPRVPWWRRAGAPRRALTLGLAVVALLVLGAIAVPPVRDTLARIFHVSGVDLQRVPRDAPTPSATSTAGSGLRLGAPVSLAEARRRATFPLRVPAVLGQPDGVYVVSGPSGTAVTLVYLPRSNLPASGSTGVGALVTELPGSVNGAFLLKLAGPGTRVEDAAVGPDPAYWITGHPHQVVVELGQDAHPEDLRLAGDTLVWSNGTVVSRVEAAVPRGVAIDIASSMR
jgi:hypothetical protein